MQSEVMFAGFGGQGILLSAKMLAHAAMDYSVPVSFGLLTTDSLEQALDRAGTKAGNKGAEAAMSAIEMVNLLRQLA